MSAGRCRSSRRRRAAVARPRLKSLTQPLPSVLPRTATIAAGRSRRSAMAAASGATSSGADAPRRWMKACRMALSGPSREARDERQAVADRAEDAALHRHHLDRRLVVAPVGGAAAVLEQQALEAAVVGLAHRGVDADVSRDAGQHDIADAAGAQDQLEVGGAERSLARLVDHGLLGERRQPGDDLPAGLAADQDAAAGPGIADAGPDPARAPALVLRQVGEVGPVPLAGVEDVVAL